MSNTTPEQFVQHAWRLDFRIVSADKEQLSKEFIKKATEQARAQGVDVQYIDLAGYENPVDAFMAPENSTFLNAIEDGSCLRLLWFDNCDCLAPLSCDLTYTLRSILTNRLSGNVQSVFIAQSYSLSLLFSDSRAAFYQSNFPIT